MFENLQKSTINIFRANSTTDSIAPRELEDGEPSLFGLERDLGQLLSVVADIQAVGKVGLDTWHAKGLAVAFNDEVKMSNLCAALG